MYHIGDKVTVKTVQELIYYGYEEERFGNDEYILMDGGSYAFIDEMKCFCGRELCVASIESRAFYKLKDEHGALIPWIWEDFMLKPVNETVISPAEESEIALLYT